MNSKCIQGTIFDEIFGDCLTCKDVFNCHNCDESGCLSCDSGRPSNNGKCSEWYLIINI